MGKSKKCPNLLFCKWIKEWVDEAHKNGWQSYHTYKKSLKSLEKFPMPLKSGSECSILQGFGPKICTQLDKQLNEYADQLGLSIKEALAVGNSALMTNKAVTSNRHELKPSSSCPEVSPTSTSESHNQNLERSKLRLSTNVDYMPRYRSGGYALLLTLYRNWENNGNGACMNKNDLMREAQTHSDTSFFMPSNNNSHYTAWSSMSTLTHKRFVVKISNPAKYYLTDEGIELCKKMIEAVNQNGLDASSSSLQIFKSTSSSVNIVKTSTSTIQSFNETECSVSQSSLFVASQSGLPQKRKHYNEGAKSSLKIYRDSSNPLEMVDLSSDEEVALVKMPLAERLKKSVDANTYCLPKKTAKLDEQLSIDFNTNRCSSTAMPLKTSLTPASEFLRESSALSLIFSYFSDYHKPVNSKDEAAVSIEDDFGAGFLIKSSYSGLLSSGYRYKLDINGLEHADPGFIFAYLHNENAPDLSNWKDDEKSVDPIDPDPIISTETNNNCMMSQEKIIVKSSSTTSLLRCSPVICNKQPNSNSNEKTDFNTKHSQSQTSLASGNSEFTVKSGVSSEESALQEWRNGDEKPTVMHVFTPEEYSISLCIDNREHFGMGKVKQMLLPALLKNKVTCDVRPLPIGDFLWIAKTLDGREAVLDFVIERKRIDDLASSITDGRFTEQKFRLKRTGIRRVIYLIEVCTGFKNLSLPIDRLLQSITNSQIIDNCDIKIVRSAEDTFTFLTLMTKKIQQIYAKKILSVMNVFPNDRTPWGEDIALDYESFNNSSQKTPALSVRELFAKCLLQIKYMTADKTVAILDKYPTPKSLMSAYEALISLKEKESMLADISYKTFPKKTIGMALSKSVYYAYNNS